MGMRRWKSGESSRNRDESAEAVTIDPEKARERTMQRAIKLLAAKPRAIAELRERLLEKKWTDEETVGAVLEKLCEYGYLNDQQFAEGYAAFHLRQKPVGRQRLQRALALKKVDKETADQAIDQVLSETSEEKLIGLVIEKRVRLRGKPSTREETRKLFDHLLRRGFPYDLVIQKVRELSSTALDEE
jgi:regulatory protein